MNLTFKSFSEYIKKHKSLLYFILVLVLLFPVWINKYFITQDSPTHFYNARIFLDYLLGRNTDFYNEYYHSNISLFPYWFGHISLAFLLWIFPPFIAEKLIFSIYIILFAYITKKIISFINKESSFLSFLILPFACNYGFQMGFISYMYSFIFFCLIVSFFLKHKSDFRIKHTLIITILFIITYFSHAVFWAFSIVAVFTLLAFSILSNTTNIQTFLNEITKSLRIFLFLLLSLIPSAIIFILFIIKNPNYDTGLKFYSLDYILHSFLTLKTLVLVSEKEAPFALAIGFIIAVLLVISMLKKILSKTLSIYDGFYLLALLALFVDVYGSINFIGFLERLQFLPFVFLIFWVASFKFPSAIKYSVICISFIITVSLVGIRYPTYRRAYLTLKEFLSAQSYIKEKSTILTLGFNQTGTAPDGKEVTTFTNPFKLILFANSGNYFGTLKPPLIVLDNVFALYNQFPYTWRVDRCAFFTIQESGSLDGIYGNPPNVDLLSYTAKTKGSIDYVLLRNYSDEYASNPKTINLFKQLNQAYKLIYVSKTGIVRLYRKIGLEDYINDAEKNPSEENLINLCKYYFSNNDFARCLGISEKLISKYPADTDVWVYAGASCLRLDQLQKAITYLNKSLKLSPDNSFIIEQLKVAHNIIKADSVFNITSNPQVLLSLSYTYYVNKLYEKSIRSCEKALTVSPNNADAYNNICACYNSLSKWELAIKACNKALEIKPDLVLAKNNLNWAKMNLKNKQN